MAIVQVCSVPYGKILDIVMLSPNDGPDKVLMAVERTEQFNYTFEVDLSCYHSYIFIEDRCVCIACRLSSHDPSRPRRVHVIRLMDDPVRRIDRQLHLPLVVFEFEPEEEVRVSVPDEYTVPVRSSHGMGRRQADSPPSLTLPTVRKIRFR